MSCRIGFRAALLQALALASAGCAPVPKALPPPAGRGPVAIVLSGMTGPSSYRDAASRLTRLGYYTVLLDGNDLDPRSSEGAARLREEIARAQGAPEALPGKVVVVGFSMGGGAALAHAAQMGDLVAAVVAYFPYVGFLHEEQVPSFASRLQVPVLVLAGEEDTYLNCCRAEAQRALAAAARGQGKQYELVVYPGAGHRFDVFGPSSARADAERRTDEMLRRHRPPP